MGAAASDQPKQYPTMPESKMTSNTVNKKYAKTFSAMLILFHAICYPKGSDARVAIKLFRRRPSLNQVQHERARNEKCRGTNRGYKLNFWQS